MPILFSSDIIFKFFAIAFSLLYFLYSMVMFQQSRTLTKTLSSNLDKLFIVIAIVQIGAALFLVFLSFNL